MAVIPLSRYVALDCEMVQCRSQLALARIAVVDYTGAEVYHSFVFVHPEDVTNYHTDITGITKSDLHGAPSFEIVQACVRELLADKIVVGHALFNDLAILQHRHVYEEMRDTALYYPLRERCNVHHEGQYPALRRVALEVLGRKIQCGSHCPLEDARATMDIFLSVREEYEAALASGDDVVAAVPG
ncbi:ribonuclease H-like protein [Cutaneotrichosporon oleaginosum]|uniref:Ribonuclease H-like protein n=1 Tax=Cutaneotrichosporon oleaginosum TaxID=879819 RepID=A0A0J0XGL0_9TREE|nr:ribonuclease H-like protein [Cutaneotrichosporon oleaginosum]KLT40162.1 ribonuclease H-like protein [Cutaneotrichosporon oleaginosum]TXT06873.1 hypothetical protein COLE_06204 [Cutaneotrichosporon oleaginosum]